MSRIRVVIIALIAVIAAVALFHLIHHYLFCRYRLIPGRSHCGKCGHRRVCKKWHHKAMADEQENIGKRNDKD